MCSGSGGNLGEVTINFSGDPTKMLSFLEASHNDITKAVRTALDRQVEDLILGSGVQPTGLNDSANDYLFIGLSDEDFDEEEEYDLLAESCGDDDLDDGEFEELIDTSPVVSVNTEGQISIDISYEAGDALKLDEDEVGFLIEKLSWAQDAAFRLQDRTPF